VVCQLAYVINTNYDHDQDASTERWSLAAYDQLEMGDGILVWFKPSERITC